MVAVSQVGMVSGQFVAAGFMVLCCFLMVACRVFVVLGGLMMMFRCLLGHEMPPMRRRKTKSEEQHDNAATIAPLYCGSVIRR